MRPRLWRIIMRTAALPIFHEKQRIRLLRWLGVGIDQTNTIPDGVFIGSPLVRFGKHAGCNVGCHLDGSGSIELGESVRLGAEVMIITGTHPIEPDELRRDLAKPTIARPVRIGRGSWLASRVIVLPGVTIGEGCVVSAGAVVTRDLPPNALYAGNPAQWVRDLPLEVDTNVHRIGARA